ncbi:PepSY domain-containing protein [Carboxylicivirga sp. M1479]|uniref:PepSY domain-containing protein n=1 Tax=Carboxylicivirga sp. M1479 TaxID=2594476 RepID=UPI001177CC38|nr:PepSY domain-containing protein [Carboxylicivirga sp. M1479]TRX70403.1 PepSY domain-containing protein [Carboxylicivirga sp. M1479]
MKFWRKYHKWTGIILCFFLLIFSISGILLNHRQVISSIDVPRQLLSSSYQYNNWNSAALKGSVVIDSTHTLFYGNVGCWQYSKANNTWHDYNQGFPKGIDNRKISKLLLTNQQRLFAGTLFGLYEYDGHQWQAIQLNINHQRITDLIEIDNQLIILTRSEIGRMNLSTNDVEFSFLPTPASYQGTSSLFKTIWVLHSGEILGFTGKILVDIIGLLFIFLSITGLIWFYAPGLIKKASRKKKKSTRKKQSFQFSVRWHNKIGYYALVLLIFTTFTGMFLRPPLLITIANSQVKNIPYTLLDSDNAWYDQLRAIRFNSTYQVYLVSTNKGMYALTTDFKDIVKVPNQPPVSVMGINVFEQKESDSYLVGSFSGLYLWNPFSSTCLNYLTGKQHRATQGMARPIGTHMASGYHTSTTQEVYFDYNTGVQFLQAKSQFPDMPKEIILASPLSLWNLALEIHTGRIFQDLLGPFYILIVPLVGLSTILLLLSGLWIYLKKYRKYKQNKGDAISS